MIGKTGTTIREREEEEGDTEVTVEYRGTPVVTFNSSVIVLNTGGWYSATTSRRMNEVAREYELEYRVFRRVGRYYCEYGNKLYSFLGDTLWLIR